MLDAEKADTQQQSISKLRARRAAVEADKDPRYSGKKVLRKDLKKDSEAEYDPELAKLCVLEGSEEEVDEDADEDEEEDENDKEEEDEDADEEEEDGYEEEEESEDVDEEEDEEEEENESIDGMLSQKLKELGTRKSNERNFGREDEDSSEENEEVRKLYQGLQHKQKGVT